MTVAAFLLAGGGLRAAPAGQVPAGKGMPRLLVMDFKATGVEPMLAQQATMLAAQAAHSAGTYSVVTLEDVRAAVGAERLKNLTGCEGTQSCLADLAQGAGASLLLTGSVGRVGTQYTAALTLLKPGDGTVAARENLVVKSARELANGLAELVPRMVGVKTGVQATAPVVAQAGKVVSLAVLDLDSAGVTADVSKNLTQILGVELKRLAGTTVISRDDIQALLQMQEQKLQLGCDDMSCLAEVGGALGVEKLVVGSVGKLAGSYIVSLRLITVAGARVDNRVVESFTGPEDQLIRAVRHAGRRLLVQPAATPGTLALAATQQDAVVLVDGIKRGELPMAPIQGLVPGPHVVTVQKRRFQDFSADVYVDPAETTALFVDLTAVPVPWWQRWPVWTAVAVGAAVTVTVVAAVVTAGIVGAVAVFRFTQAPPPQGEGTAVLE
jgi:hypothetical protein